VKSLGFAPGPNDRADGAAPRVRRACFEARSSLPVSAACVVANGVRETVSALLGGAVVTLRLSEPCIPSPDAWPVILRDARVYRLRGSVADAAVILGPSDAVALATILFGESHAHSTGRGLSPIECDVLDRMVNAMAANLGAVCGKRESFALERAGAVAGFVTYFELLLDEPVGARIGIALSRDPSPQLSGALDIAQLARVQLEASAVLDLGTVAAAQVARVAVGSLLPIAGSALNRCALTAHRRRLARGNCGVRNGRFAFAVDAVDDARNS
jgi:hypothetical protein